MELNILVLVLGSLGPSTVTLMAFVYVVISTGRVFTIMVSEKLFPVSENNTRKNSWLISGHELHNCIA
jgi:hypothetical protein